MTGGQPHDGPLTVPRDHAAGRGRGRQDGRRRHRRAGQVPAERRLRARRHDPPSRRARRRAARAARDPGPHRAGLRPDLRRREAPPPQARHLPRSGQARVHQRRGLRGLRRLLGEEQLRVGEAARDRARPQAPDRPEQLQQGLLLRRTASARASCRCMAARPPRPRARSSKVVQDDPFAVAADADVAAARARPTASW